MDTCIDLLAQRDARPRGATWQQGSTANAASVLSRSDRKGKFGLSVYSRVSTWYLL